MRRGKILAPAVLLVLALRGDARGQQLPGEPPRPAVPDQAPAAPAAHRSLDEVIAEIKAAYPDLTWAALGHEELAERLLKAAEALDGGSPGANVVRARWLAADLLEAVGQAAKARDLWARAAKEGPGAEVQARGFYCLGLHYLLRERYKDAWNYWKLIGQLAPDSPWAARAARCNPFLRMAATREVPDFKGSFGELGEKSRDDFKGRPLLLYFWQGAAPGAKEAAGRLFQALEGARKSGWDGAVAGVNLDTGREKFEEARDGWWNGPPGDDHWIIGPQHHDGKGFESSPVRALGIPRVPLYLLIGSDGPLQYAGSSEAELGKAMRAR